MHRTEMCISGISHCWSLSLSRCTLVGKFLNKTATMKGYLIHWSIFHTWHYPHLSTEAKKMSILRLPKRSLISALMTSSTKWDFSPLQPFPRDMPTISLTPPGKGEKKKTTTILDKLKHYFFSPRREMAVLRKKNYEYDTKWIVFAPGGTADKKLEGIRKKLFFIFFKCVFHFCSSGHAIQWRRGRRHGRQ